MARNARDAALIAGLDRRSRRAWRQAYSGHLWMTLRSSRTGAKNFIRHGFDGFFCLTRPITVQHGFTDDDLRWIHAYVVRKIRQMYGPHFVHVAATRDEALLVPVNPAALLMH